MVNESKWLSKTFMTVEIDKQPSVHHGYGSLLEGQYYQNITE